MLTLLFYRIWINLSRCLLSRLAGLEKIGRNVRMIPQDLGRIVVAYQIEVIDAAVKPAIFTPPGMMMIEVRAFRT